MTISRRLILGTPLLGMLSPSAWPAGTPLALLREGGLVVAMRHALAPGTFDPPEFRLGDCSTQRNLDDAGRAQARRIGQWFKRQGLRPARVRSSPWCRCLDTARLAFDQAEPWDALGSPRASDPARNAEHLAALRQALAAVSRQAGRFEVWVTHQFVLNALGAAGADSGEALLLRGSTGEANPQVLGRMPPP
jgi:phosphohistidine phosphatase SixA